MSNNSISYHPSPPVRVLRALWRGFEVFSNVIDTFWMTFAIALLVSMWGLLLVNTVAKWLDIYSVGYTLEFVKYMMAWSIFVVMGAVTRTNDHIRVSFFPEKLLGERRGAVFMYVTENLVALGMCIYFTIHAYRFIIESYNSDFVEHSIGGWNYQMWIIRIGILVGFLFASLFYFERTMKMIKNFITHTEQEVVSAGFMGSSSSSTKRKKDSQLETGAETQAPALAGTISPSDEEKSNLEEQA
ncbi:TRAP transporter small permease [Chloroflexota bacterium]